MHDKPVALVTGANKGIGLQIAKDLAARGFTVLVGSRNLKNGQAAAQTVATDARALQLDVTNQASIAAAAERIRKDFGRLDVLVNNAGIATTGKPGRPLAEIVKAGRPSVASLDEVRAIFETNLFGVIAVTQAMLPLLREAPSARIVNVSSSTGSLALNSDPANPRRAMFGAYSWSKTALNAVTVAFAAELDSARIKVNAASPASPPQTSTTSRARAPSSKPRASLSASRCSMPAAPQAPARATKAKFPGDSPAHSPTRHVPVVAALAGQLSPGITTVRYRGKEVLPRGSPGP